MLATLGKVVIDATHSLDSKPGQLPALYVGFSDSLGEQVRADFARRKPALSYRLYEEALTQMKKDENKPELKDEFKSKPRLRTGIRGGALDAAIYVKGAKQG